MTQVAAIALGIVLLAGFATALQAPINAALSRDIGGTVPAAAISFGVGFIVLTIASFATGQAESFTKVSIASPIVLVGGILGAFYVWSLLFAIPTLGALTTFAVLILGQMAAAITLDAAGGFGLAVQSITLSRVAAAVFVAVGVILSRL